MTDPTPPAETPAEALQVQIAVGPGPDGRACVLWTMRAGIAAFTLVLPPEMADDLAGNLPDLLRQGAEAARRANSGLYLPTGVQLHTNAGGRRG